MAKYKVNKYWLQKPFHYEIIFFIKISNIFEFRLFYFRSGEEKLYNLFPITLIYLNSWCSRDVIKITFIQSKL